MLPLPGLLYLLLDQVGQMPFSVPLIHKFLRGPCHLWMILLKLLPPGPPAPQLLKEQGHLLYLPLIKSLREPPILAKMILKGSEYTDSIDGYNCLIDHLSS